MNRFTKYLVDRFGVSKLDASVMARTRADMWRLQAKEAVHYTINERAALAARLAAVAVDGHYGVIVSGMDCDCTQYRRESVRPLPRSLFAYWRALCEDEQWLDGPQRIAYVRPDEARDGYHNSSDRALAAYEDGHPHVVTTVDLG